MIKLRNFWLVLALGCAVSLGTTSCDDDDDESKQEQPSNNNNNSSTPLLTPEQSGTVMKSIVENITKDESTLLAQASTMTKAELTNLASAIIEYDKNKDNKEWVETFIKNAGSEKASAILDEAIAKLVGEGVDMSEMTPEIFVETFGKYFTPVDQLGQGYKDGLAEGATHEKLFNAIYDDKIATMDVESYTSLLTVYNSLTSDQQAELIKIASSWNAKENDQDWKNGFVKGVGLNDEAKEKDLTAKLDALAPMVTAFTSAS